MDLDDATHAQHEAELGLMQATLEGEGFTTQLIPHGDELPVAALVVSLGPDDKERQRLMTVSIMPFGVGDFPATDFVQFYVPMPFSVSGPQMGDLGHAVAVVNGAMALGHFGVRGTEVFFRYMLAYDSASTVDGDMLVELVTMLTFHQEHFADYLEGVLEGEVSLQVLPQLISQTNP